MISRRQLHSCLEALLQFTDGIFECWDPQKLQVFGVMLMNPQPEYLQHLTDYCYNCDDQGLSECLYDFLKMHEICQTTDPLKHKDFFSTWGEVFLHNANRLFLKHKSI